MDQAVDKAGDTSYAYDAEDARTTVTTPQKREVYVTDKSQSLSRVLEIRIYEKTPEGTGYQTSPSTTNTITYGNGLIREKEETNTQSKTRYHHYDHLGSTVALSDETGTITTEYTYGSYGELLSGDRSQTKFRYNGIYGVISDENGLYYMRARYYNVDIRRFINQDIIRGNVSESQSLNRYSYVQGNLVNLVDPFGLSPYMSWKDMGHTVLDVLGFIPGIGDVFDIANAVWYAAEGNWAMAGISFMSAIPFVGSFLGSGVKLTFKGIDLGCAIAQGSKIIGYGYNTVRAGEQAGNGAIQMIRRYAVEGKEVGWHTVGEAGEVLLFSALTVMSGKASVSAAGQKVSGGVGGKGVSGDVGNNPLQNVKYTEKVNAQMKQGDYHSFPESVDAFGESGKTSTIVGGDNISRTKVEIAGSYDGKEGVFEYIIEPDGTTVNHRLFKAN